jgi:DNA-binding NarL/FixJ family response regulator
MNTIHPVRVLLADDHALFREGIAKMLSTDGNIEVVGEAENGEETVAVARETKPDVVLLDVEMPVMDVEEVIGLIQEVSPGSRVVVLTMYEDPRLVRKVLNLGASGYVAKNVRMRQLLATVHATAQDEAQVVLSISRKAMDQLEGRGKEHLTDRELEILLHVARGMRNCQIASTLYLTEGTVKRHLVNIYRKLKVRSRSEATRRALSEGWIIPRDVVRADGKKSCKA